MKNYVVQMLGTFQCLYKDQPLQKLPTGKQQLLFTYLVLHPDTPINRKYFAFQLWPDSSEKQALTNFRKLVFRLKNLLPEADVHLGLQNGHILWNSLNQLEVDVTLFEKLSQSYDINDLKKSVEIFSGEFLPGFDAEWVSLRREMINHCYIAAIEKLMIMSEDIEDYEQALKYAIKLSYLDRLSEPFHLNIIRQYVRKGDFRSAQRRFEEMKMILWRDLGMDPSSDTLIRYGQLMEFKS